MGWLGDPDRRCRHYAAAGEKPQASGSIGKQIAGARWGGGWLPFIQSSGSCAVLTCSSEPGTLELIPEDFVLNFGVFHLLYRKC
jgi:hypothetical protein